MKKRIIPYKTVLILLICLSACMTVQATRYDSDIEKIKKNLFEISLYYSDTQNDDIKSFISNMNTQNGLFTDLDYHGQAKSEWNPGIHWRRLSAMAIAYHNPADIYYLDKHLKDAIVNGIDSWIKHPYTAENGWWNLIGIPTEMAKVMILMENELKPTVISGQIKTINRAVKPDFYDYYGPATGENLLWETLNHIYASVLTNDTCGIRRASTASATEMRISEKEGIQSDYSFFQHGNQSYAFGYGKAFSLTAAQIIYALSDTRFAIPKKNIDIITKYILDGQQWCSYEQMLEYTSMGREIARPDDKTAPLIKAATLMLKAQSERGAEFEDFIKQLKGIQRTHTLKGTRFFPKVDLYVQQGNHYFFSVKGASKQIVSTEIGNGENLKGYYLGLGTQFMTRTGNEYKDIFPIWDWKRIPGSIAEQDDSPLVQYSWTKGAEGSSSFVDGIAEGDEGVLAYDYQKDGILAKRSWFFSDGIILMMTSDINFKKDKDVYLNINQCYQNGKVCIDGKILKNDMTQIRAKKIWQDSIGYYFPMNDKLVISGKTQTGAWKDINTARSDKKISANVFSLSCNMGKDAKKKKQVCFILPGINENERFEDRCNTLEILCNDGMMQAVRNTKSGNIYAAIYGPTKYRIPNTGYSIDAKLPAVCEISFGNGLVRIVTATENGTKTRVLHSEDIRNKVIQMN